MIKEAVLGDRIDYGADLWGVHTAHSTLLLAKRK